MLFVVLLLNFAATISFAYGALHAAGHIVGIHNNATIDVAGGATNGLNERRFATQKALFVGVKDSDK